MMTTVRTPVDSSDVGALRVLVVLVVGDSWVKQCVDGSYRVLCVRKLQVAGAESRPRYSYASRNPCAH
jgi:hypothetical protein